MRTIRLLTYYILMTLFVQPAFGVAGRLSGKVKDKEGKPIEKVLITIELIGEMHQNYTAQTNSKGEYIHIGINPGKYHISPSKEGYAPVEYSYIDTTVTLSDKPAVADFTMQKVVAQTGAPKAESQESEQIKEAKIGVSLLNEGKVDEAIAALNKALELDPNLASVHYNLGVAYDNKDQAEEARKHFQEAIKIKPDFGEAYQALGDSCLAAKKFDEAAEALTKALELMPQSYEVAYNLGVSYSNGGKYAEAESAYRKAVELNPKEPIAHYQVGMSLLGQSKNAEARVEFQKYLELSPNAADKQEVQDLIQTLQ